MLKQGCVIACNLFILHFKSLILFEMNQLLIPPPQEWKNEYSPVAKTWLKNKTPQIRWVCPWETWTCCVSVVGKVKHQAWLKQKLPCVLAQILWEAEDKLGLNMHGFLLEEMWVMRENGEGGTVWLQCKPEPHGGVRKEGQLGRSVPDHQQAVSGRFGMAVTKSASEESHLSQAPACRSIPLTFSLLLLEQQSMGMCCRAWQLGQDSEIGKVHPQSSL